LKAKVRLKVKLENIPALEKYRVKAEIATYEDKSIYHVEDAKETSYILKIFQKTYKYHLYESLSKLTHENMPQIHDVALFEDCFYVIEDYIAGRTLRETLDESGALSKKEMLGILMQLCDVLAYLHNQPTPIIHRDITPTNIMVTDGGIVKLIDFDIAREHKDEATSDTEVIGTKHFAPPEQYGFSQSDPRTDIYALGMLMTVMMTNTYEVQRVKDSQIASVIERCMKLSPDKRFQTVKKLKGRLDRISNNKHSPQVKIIAAFVMTLVVAVLWIAVSQRNVDEAFVDGDTIAIEDELTNGDTMFIDDAPASDNAHLEHITLRSMADSSIEDFDIETVLAFDPDTFEYVVNLPYDFGTFQTEFAPYNRASSAVVHMADYPIWIIENFINTVSMSLTSDASIQNIMYIPAGGECTATIVITSEDGTTSETYEIRYIRQSTEDAERAGINVIARNNARLAFITLTPFADTAEEEFDVTLSPAFDSDVFDYTVYLPYDAGSFLMSFSTYNRSSSANIYMNNENIRDIINFLYSAPSIGFTTDLSVQALYIPVGEEIIVSMDITSADFTATETYVVRYIRRGADE
jgi:serine/threonine protein kinase